MRRNKKGNDGNEEQEENDDQHAADNQGEEVSLHKITFFGAEWKYRSGGRLGFCPAGRTE